ncbi:integrator complex subunit 6-like [Acinonyx jubatus]|uniref:Integrator complex subunit 6-like n=1 Tax=Acinonyx jubatus TaxID=32536 RepID=A0A6J1YZH9_ACIJB|nr:integrator complex subunit 6-like [Acinonyx jubatus]
MMTDKAEESAVGPENQMKRHGEPMTSPLCKRRLTMAMLSVTPEGEGASEAGGSAVCLEDDDPKVTAVSVLEEGPGKLPKTMEITAEMKHQLKKEIQRFGQQYDRVFKLLEGVQEPLELRQKFCRILQEEGNKI